MSTIKTKYFLTYAFLSIILIFPCLHIIKKDKEFSIIENRYLENFPKISLEDFISGSFNNSLSKYLEDHFPFRDQFISLKSYFEILMGRRDINGVYVSKDNYLMEVFKDIDMDLTNKNLTLINNFSKNYNLSVMLVPTSTEILNSYLPKFAPNVNQSSYLKYIEENLNPNIKLINPIPFLKDKSGDYIYYKTDHHYTTLGAYYCYLKFCYENNITPLYKEDFNIVKISNNFLGSLFSKINLINQEKDSIYIFENKLNNELRVEYPNKISNTLYEFSYLNNPREQYNIFLDNNHSLIKIKTSVNNNNKLCIIKDSYANSFITFLVNHFKEIHIIDLRFYKSNINKYLIENNLKDILIYYNIKNFSEDRNLIFIDTIN